jgi:hypothetical protein
MTGAHFKALLDSPVHMGDQLPISADCVFDASLVPGTCLRRFVDLKRFIQQVPGESDYRTSLTMSALSNRF